MTLSYSLALQHLSTAYAAAQLTPVQVMRDVCAAMDARGDDHVWIHRLSLSEVLAQVEAAERRRAKGNTALPLFGIPFAIKDNMDAAGHPTTAGCPAFRYIAQSTAHVVFEQARGWDPQDAYSRRDTTSVAAAALSQGFRFGIPQPRQLEFFGDAEAERLFKHSIETLRGLGGTPMEIDFAPFAETAGLLYQGPWVAERLAAIKEFFAAHADDMHPVTRQIIGGARKYSAVDAFEASYRLQALQQRCAETWGEIDVLAVPTTGTIYTLEEIAAEPIAHNTRLGYYTNFVNLLDLAAVAVPAGFRRDGLPAGITLIAPACSELSLSTLGSRFHRASGVPLGATGFAMSDDSPA